MRPLLLRLTYQRPEVREIPLDLGPTALRPWPKFRSLSGRLQALSERLFWAVLDQLQKFSPGFATGAKNWANSWRSVEPYTIRSWQGLGASLVYSRLGL